MVHDAVGAIETLRRDDVFVIKSFVEEPTRFVFQLNVAFGREFSETTITGHTSDPGREGCRAGVMDFRETAGGRG
jgi:hypothetical protein